MRLGRSWSLAFLAVVAEEFVEFGIRHDAGEAVERAFSAISRADLMKAFMATRASVPPTLMRRTPISARSLTVKPNAPPSRKLIGFGATALIVATICSRVLMPGE